MKGISQNKSLFPWVLCMVIVCVIQAGCNSSSEGSNEVKEEKLYVVEIAQMNFKPAEIQVKRGDKIKFVNHDMVAHDVTEQSKKAWSSSTLQPDQEWILEVKDPADYYCTIHPMMKGRITFLP